MRLALRTFLTVVATGLAATCANAGDAKTIRIEPRAFYGATISLESGVRVFRPLPSASHVIINPNRTPVNITVKDVTKRVRSTSHNYFYGASPSYGSRTVGGYLPLGNGFRGHRSRGHHRGIRHVRRGPGRGHGRR